MKRHDDNGRSGQSSGSHADSNKKYKRGDDDDYNDYGNQLVINYKITRTTNLEDSLAANASNAESNPPVQQFKPDSDVMEVITTSLSALDLAVPLNNPKVKTAPIAAPQVPEWKQFVRGQTDHVWKAGYEKAWGQRAREELKTSNNNGTGLSLRRSTKVKDIVPLELMYGKKKGVSAAASSNAGQDIKFQQI